MAQYVAPVARQRKRGPKPRLGEEPRQRIHDAALACFERQGVRATSMDDIAKELGVSRPTVYYYFSTKEQLLLEVVARQAGLILDDIGRRLTGTPGIERLVEAAFLGLVASLDNKYVRMLVAGEVASRSGKIMGTERILELQRAFWLPLLHEARDNGQLRTDRPLREIMEWIIFLQFTLAASGSSFGLSRDDMRLRLIAYLGPALRG